MFMLNDSCVGCLTICVIHHGISLIVGYFKPFLFKTQRTPLQISEAKAEILINSPREDNRICQVRQLTAILQEIYSRTYLYTMKQGTGENIISSNGDALIRVVEIVIVEGIAYGKALDDKSGKFRTLPSPLLLRVAFNKKLVNIPPN